MGYQDRDYFREEHTPYLDLIRSTRVCWGIVIVVAVGFLLTQFTEDATNSLQDHLRLNPRAMVQDWQWYRLLTAVFVTDRPWHLAFALLLIWLLGHELEQIAGGLELLIFFLLTTILSNLAVTLVYSTFSPHDLPSSLFRHELSSFGPAGAAVAMLAWAVVLGPSRVATYLFIPMPMWIVGLLVLVFDLFFFMQYQPILVKLAVHGLSVPFACAYGYFHWRLTAWPRWVRLRRTAAAQHQLTAVLPMPSRRNASLREPRPAPPRPVSRVPTVDEQLEAKLDTVLEKVSASGMHSLTEEEKNILKKASEVLKKRKG